MTEPMTNVHSNRIGAVRRDLLWIADRWADVHESRLKGTARPWRAPQVSPDTRSELDAQARLEKADRIGLTMGESPAPVHVDVLDTLADILMRADMLHDHIAQTLGVERLDPAPSAFADPKPYLAFIGEHLADFAADDTDGLNAVSDLARELREDMAAVLGEIADGQTLDALCPFCGGKDGHHPNGGAKTLRVRNVPLPRMEDRDHHEAVIMCVGGMCAPAENECGVYVRGLPAWPMSDWDWLAERLDAA